MRRCICRLLAGLVPATLALSGLTVTVNTPPAHAAPADPPCWMSFDPPNPGPNATLNITYNNCADSDNVVTPFQTDGSTIWVYKECRSVPAHEWRTWTVTTPTNPVNFGVGHCSDQPTDPISDVSDICWTSFEPSNPSPGDFVIHSYENCGASAEEVAPAYQATDGDWGFFLHDGCATVAGNEAASWSYHVPSDMARLTTVFCIP